MWKLTNIVRGIAGGLESVSGVGLFGKPKVGQLQHPQVVCNDIFNDIFTFLYLVAICGHLTHTKYFLLRRDNLLIGSDQLDQLYHFISSRLPIRRSQSFDEDLSPKLGQTGSNTKLEPFFVKSFTLWSCKTKRENQMVQVRAVRLHTHPWFWSYICFELTCVSPFLV